LLPFRAASLWQTCGGIKRARACTRGETAFLLSKQAMAAHSKAHELSIQDIAARFIIDRTLRNSPDRQKYRRTHLSASQRLDAIDTEVAEQPQ